MKTHCKHGHEYTPENTILGINPRHGGTFRNCRQCKNARKEIQRRAHGKPKAGKVFFRVRREDLRRLVDVVWNEATESTAVPSTNWADRLIDRALPAVPNG